MEKIIRITKEHFTINSRVINWKDIVGLRAFTSPRLRHVGTRFPFAELFIKGGKTLKIRRQIYLKGVEIKRYEDNFKNKYNSFYTFMEIIAERAINRKDNISNWVEWRIALPIICAEIILGFYGIFAHKSLDEIILIGIIGGIMSVPLGLLWEHKARKKKWQ